MKEDKENTKPKEKRCEHGVTEDGEKPERMKEKKEVMSKVIIRRLPPSLTKEQLEEHLQPLPDHDYFEFFSNDSSLFPHLFSRAYINFKSQDDIVLFRDRFDGYVFIDHRGQEYPAVVEFAPFQKVAKRKNKKKDSKTGTIEEDPEYRKFLDSYSMDEEKLTSTPETLLEEIEARNKEMIAKKTTPLLSFLKNRQRIRDEKREERRRRELERKRLREEERRKWKEDERRKRKDAEKQKKFEKAPEKELDRPKDETKIKVAEEATHTETVNWPASLALKGLSDDKLLKKSEKDEERDTEKKFKSRKIEKENVKEEQSTMNKRSDGEIVEEKLKRNEEYVKDYREKDYERERRLREKEKMRYHEDDRRKPRDRYEKDRCFRRRDDDYRKDREVVRERGRKPEQNDCPQNTDKSERITRDEKKDDAAKRDRIRNKDRPAMQLYTPGARSRSRLTTCDESPVKSSSDQTTENKQECETNDMGEGE